MNTDLEHWRIGFFGSTEFSAFALHSLLDANIRPVMVCSQPDRARGRGHRQKPTIISQIAQDHNLALYTPKDWDHAIRDQIKQAALDVAIVVAYGLILPTEILNLPRYGCLNIHPSALPRWRGAAPIQRAIQAGDHHSAVCVIRMDQGIDTGDILWQQPVELKSHWNAGDWHDEAGKIGALGLLSILPQLPTLQPKPQSKSGVCYAAMITREEIQIDFHQPAPDVANHIRAFAPKPGAWCLWQEKRLCLCSATVIDQDKNGSDSSSLSARSSGARSSGAISSSRKSLAKQIAIGEVCDHLFTIQTAKGKIRPDCVRLEGKKAMSTAEFLHGHTVHPGELLIGRGHHG